ncbi:MAG: hypothetical protein WC135_06030 [Bacteroidales bacterium]
MNKKSNEILMHTIVSDKFEKIDLNIIISKLENEFSLIDFIQEFAQEYEEEYIEMLFVYRVKGAFIEVRSQISSYLSTSEDLLNIERIAKTDTQNIFGKTVEVPYWKKK